MPHDVIVLDLPGRNKNKMFDASSTSANTHRQSPRSHKSATTTALDVAMRAATLGRGVGGGRKHRETSSGTAVTDSNSIPTPPSSYHGDRVATYPMKTSWRGSGGGGAAAATASTVGQPHVIVPLVDADDDISALTTTRVRRSHDPNLDLDAVTGKNRGGRKDTSATAAVANKTSVKEQAKKGRKKKLAFNLTAAKAILTRKTSRDCDRYSTTQTAGIIAHTSSRNNFESAACRQRLPHTEVTIPAKEATADDDDDDYSTDEEWDYENRRALRFIEQEDAAAEFLEERKKLAMSRYLRGERCAAVVIEESDSEDEKGLAFYSEQEEEADLVEAESTSAFNDRLGETAVHEVDPLRLRDHGVRPNPDVSIMQARLETLRLQRQILGETQPDVALTLNNIGNILFDRKEYGQAMQAYNEALNVSKGRASSQKQSSSNLFMESQSDRATRICELYSQQPTNHHFGMRGSVEEILARTGDIRSS